MWRGPEFDADIAAQLAFANATFSREPCDLESRFPRPFFPVLNCIENAVHLSQSSWAVVKLPLAEVQAAAPRLAIVSTLCLFSAAKLVRHLVTGAQITKRG